MIDVSVFKQNCESRGINPASKLARMLRQDPISKTKRKAQLRQEQNCVCAVCGKELSGKTDEIDHIKEVAVFTTAVLDETMSYWDGYDALHNRENLRLVHRDCNRGRNRRGAQT